MGGIGWLYKIDKARAFLEERWRTRPASLMATPRGMRIKRFWTSSGAISFLSSRAVIKDNVGKLVLSEIQSIQDLFTSHLRTLCGITDMVSVYYGLTSPSVGYRAHWGIVAASSQAASPGAAEPKSNIWRVTVTMIFW